MSTADQHSHAEVEVLAVNRFEEYKTVMQQYSQVSSRRQGTSSLFIGINGIVLTGIGFLIVSSHLNTWWLVAEIAAIAIGILPVNWAWYRTMHQYRSILLEYYSYLREIEAVFEQPADGTHKIGLYSRLGNPTTAGRFGTANLERFLALYFSILYLVIAAIASMIVYLTTNGYLPPAYL